MKIVIDIPEGSYKAILNGYTNQTIMSIWFDSVRNGTPLDLDGLKSDMKALNCGYPYGLDYLLDCLDKRLGITITESNREEGEN